MVDGARAVRVDLRDAVERHRGHRTPRFKTRIQPATVSFSRLAARRNKGLGIGRAAYSAGVAATLLRDPPHRVSAGRRARDDAGRRPGRIRIERIWPELDCGRYPVKRAVGDPAEVWATIVRDGHEVLGARAALPAARGAPLA